MALKIRLRRMGRRNAPTYRIVVAESSMPRDGRIIASIGNYNPRTDPLTLSVDRDKALQWISKGAVPTDTTRALLKRAGVFRPEEQGVVAAAAEGAKQAAGAARGAAGRMAGLAENAAERVAESVSDAAGAVREAAAGSEEEAPSSEEPVAAAEPAVETEPAAASATESDEAAGEVEAEEPKA